MTLGKLLDNNAHGLKFCRKNTFQVVKFSVVK